MKSKIINIAPEGNIFVCTFIAITIMLFLINSILGLIGLALTVWCALFFRDPDRVTPQDDSLIIAPADGKIINIETLTPAQELGLKGEYIKISIFMNVFNVHINRAPCAGKLENIIYHHGRFINASFDKASEENERQSFIMTTHNKDKIAFVQIAGLVARRIVKFVENESTIKAGQKIGLIRFGSRVDLYLPKKTHILVAEGQTTVAGETVVASFNPIIKKLNFNILDR